MINYSHNPHECATVNSSTYSFTDNNSQLSNNQANVQIQIDTCLFKYGIDLIRQPLSYGSACVNSKSVPLLSKSSILLNASSTTSYPSTAISSTNGTISISSSDLTSQENSKYISNVDNNKLTVNIDNSFVRNAKANSMKLLNSTELICLNSSVKTRSLSDSDEMIKSDDEVNSRISSIRENTNDNREEEINTTQNSRPCKTVSTFILIIFFLFWIMRHSISILKNWDIICKLINCKVAFKKQYNGKKYNWIQLAGHPGITLIKQ